MFFINKESEETTSEFVQNSASIVWFWSCIKIETQKIVNLLGDTDNQSSKFATIKWDVANDQSNTEYGEGDENGSTIKFETKVIKSSICDYSDVYILVTGDITATGGTTDTTVAFKSCDLYTNA